MKQLEADFSQDFEVMQIVLAERPLASLIELQTVYSLEDLYDMLEMQEAQQVFLELARQES